MKKIQFVLVLCAIIYAHAIPIESNSSESESGSSSDSDETHKIPQHDYNNGHQGSPYENPQYLNQPKPKRDTENQDPTSTTTASNIQDLRHPAVISNQNRQTRQANDQKTPRLLASNPSSTTEESSSSNWNNRNQNNSPIGSTNNRQVRQTSDQQTPPRLSAPNPVPPSSTTEESTTSNHQAEFRAYQNRQIRETDDDETPSKLLAGSSSTTEEPSTPVRLLNHDGYIRPARDSQQPDSTVCSTVVPGYVYSEHLKEAESNPSTSKTE